MNIWGNEWGMLTSTSRWLALSASIACILTSSCRDIEPGLSCGPPVAIVSENQTAVVGQVAILIGGVRLHPEDEQVCLTEKTSLTFEWEQESGPPADLEDTDQRDAFFVPLQAGVYSFRFRITYPKTFINKKPKTSGWESVNVTVTEAICYGPSADAGDNRVLTVTTGGTATAILNGSRSSPTNRGGCEGLSLSRYTWTVADQPTGANVSIRNSSQQNAEADLDILGTYKFQLEVQDSGGTDGRLDTDSDVVEVVLSPRPSCQADMSVQAVSLHDGEPIDGAHVTVVDSNGIAHTADTSTEGIAVFDALAAGARRSISVISDVKVSSITGPSTQRPKFESTTVMDICSDDITIPIRLTGSGYAALPKGTVFAKVPESVFGMLPHSWLCSGMCSPDTEDSDCSHTYYCESSDPVCKNTCTPRTLLPYFSLGGNEYSGQFRFAWLVPAIQEDGISSIALDRIFYTMPEHGQAIPSNFATDDLYLNGISPSLGVDPWGDSCVRTSDCPNREDYVCEQNPNGDYSCKDKNPLRNLTIQLPARDRVRLFLVLGIINVDQPEFLPFFIAILRDTYSVYGRDINVMDFLRSFEPRVLHVCPLTVDVTAGTINDFSETLSTLTADDCLSLSYKQKESVEPWRVLEEESVVCQSSEDCCDDSKGCGWPDSGRMCIEDPNEKGVKRCFVPMFKVEVFNEDQITVVPSVSGYEPAAFQSDERLCSWVPEEARYEVMCEYPGYPKSCDPPQYFQLPVPADADCTFPYGLTLTAMDFPAGSAVLPEGGQAIVGFDIHRTMDHFREAKINIPHLRQDSSQKVPILTSQRYFRGSGNVLNGRYQIYPGCLGSAGTVKRAFGPLYMPEFFPFLTQDSLPDAGIDVLVTFEVDDPTVWPNPSIERVYSTSIGMLSPTVGDHDLMDTLTISQPANSQLSSIVLSRVDHVEEWIEKSWSSDKIYFDVTLTDSLWRIYAPGGVPSIPLDPGQNPFSPGNEVWVSIGSRAFNVPFDYDLFPIDLILGRQTTYSEDSYAFVVP
jgi:hypothetical protein